MVTSHYKDIRVWAMKTGKVIHQLDNVHNDNITCCKMTNNEHYMVSTGLDNCVKLWDVRTWQLVSSWDHQNYQCVTSPSAKYRSDFALSPNGQFCVLGT